MGLDNFIDNNKDRMSNIDKNLKFIDTMKSVKIAVINDEIGLINFFDLPG